MVAPIDAAVVVPCYNEERRLRDDELLALAGAPGVRLIFVDDASRDGTRARLEAIRRRAPERVEVVALERNRGKAEAVRAGLLAGLARGARLVGYLDADLATPVREMLRLVEHARATGIAVVLGSRVMLLGRRIERRPHRHYLGRVFATFASTLLGLPVYDTQCGAKVLRDTPALRAALATPFLSRWAFDVELIGRLLAGDAGAPPVPPSAMVELPLEEWCDAGDSHVKPADMVASGIDLIRIGATLRERRRRAAEGK